MRNGQATKRAAKSRTLDAKPDIPDNRDRWYQPTLAPLRQSLSPPARAYVLNQGNEGACTGFGLAAVVNLLHQRQGRKEARVSAQMLYEMAKRHDEWPGRNYEGSSCRGAIKGWFHMGVCSEHLWPNDERNGNLTLDRAKDARRHTIGAYYRIRKNIVDMHAALNETGVVYVSSTVHSGWMSPKNGRIPYPPKNKEGGHAFAIVGYDTNGFYVQNSWGRTWGRNGIALWTYEDWSDNVTDAWVVQLALSTPQLYSRRPVPSGPSAGQELTAAANDPRRDEIAGHFVHIDDGKFKESGKYWSSLADIKQTAELVAASNAYQHLLIYAHGGLNSPADSARRIAAMRDTFKANGIYPLHFMYDTGLLEELKDIILGKRSEAEERAGGFADWTDRLIERATRRPGRALWREMKLDAKRVFATASSPGTQTMDVFLAAFSGAKAVPKKVHLVGHSTGGILIAHLLEALAAGNTQLRFASASLLAPAATIKLFRESYLPHLSAGPFGIDEMHVYNLSDELEKDDNVGFVYRKSLLYLVSQAFEEEIEPPAKLLGMQRYSKALENVNAKRLNFYYSHGDAGKARTTSTSHGGFDNDPATMNDILKTVLDGSPVRQPFTKESLNY